MTNITFIRSPNDGCESDSERKHDRLSGRVGMLVAVGGGRSAVVGSVVPPVEQEEAQDAEYWDAGLKCMS